MSALRGKADFGANGGNVTRREIGALTRFLCAVWHRALREQRKLVRGHGQAEQCRQEGAPSSPRATHRKSDPLSRISDRPGVQKRRQYGAARELSNCLPLARVESVP